jgi:hypothetical protein
MRFPVTTTVCHFPPFEKEKERTRVHGPMKTMILRLCSRTRRVGLSPTQRSKHYAYHKSVSSFSHYNPCKIRGQKTKAPYFRGLSLDRQFLELLWEVELQRVDVLRLQERLERPQVALLGDDCRSGNTCPRIRHLVASDVILDLDGRRLQFVLHLISFRLVD